MLRFEDSWDQSRQGLLELLEAWTSPLFLLDILTWLLIVLHPTFDIDYIIIYTYIYIYSYQDLSRVYIKLAVDRYPTKTMEFPTKDT